MKDQNETPGADRCTIARRRWTGYVRPLDCGRELGSGLCVSKWNHPAVRPGGGDEVHDLNSTTAATSAPATACVSARAFRSSAALRFRATLSRRRSLRAGEAEQHGEGNQ